MSLAQPYVENLYGTLVTFAQDMLSEHGEFYPFCFTVSPDGSLAPLAIGDAGEHPSSAQVIEMLTGALRAKASAGEIIGAGLCYDVSIKPVDGMTDAICIDIEVVDDSFRVLVPYANGDSGDVEYGEPSAADKARSLFPEPTS